MKDIQTIIKAINLANLDGITEVKISMRDLLLIRDTINNFNTVNHNQAKRIHQLESDILRLTLENFPIPSLSTYV